MTHSQTRITANNMKKLLYIFLLSPLFLTAQVQVFFGPDDKAFLTSPLDVDSLFYWFAADMAVFDSIGGVATDWQGVGEWKDLSGNGHHVTQATNGARPTYRASEGPNGKPTLVFDGTNDFLATSSHLWESDDITCFAVYRLDLTTRGAEILFARGGGTTANQFQHVLGTASGSTNRWDTYENTGVASTRKSRAGNWVKTTNWELITLDFEPTANLNLYLNSTLSNGGSPSGSGAGANIGDHSRNLTLGANNSEATPTGYMQAKLSELIIYSRFLTTAERQAIENYLNKKYNIY
jgi:hypothetical protein